MNRQYAPPPVKAARHVRPQEAKAMEPQAAALPEPDIGPIAPDTEPTPAPVYCPEPEPTPEPTPEPEPTPVPRPGFDANIATQLSTMLLSNAIAQQQLNAAAARSQLANVSNMLTLHVQLGHTAALGLVTQLSPVTAAALDQITAAGRPTQFATLQTASRTPQGKQ